MASNPAIRKTCRQWNVPWQAHQLAFACYLRRAFLSKRRTCEYLAEAIENAGAKYGFTVWAYVFMSEHAHLPV